MYERTNNMRSAHAMIIQNTKIFQNGSLVRSLLIQWVGLLNTLCTFSRQIQFTDLDIAGLNPIWSTCNTLTRCNTNFTLYKENKSCSFKEDLNTICIQSGFKSNNPTHAMQIAFSLSVIMQITLPRRNQRTLVLIYLF